MKKFAIVFPGQGSQSVGMLYDLACKNALIEKTFNEASSVLGYDLWDIVQQGPKEQLDNTVYTQPALLTASVALWRLWREEGGAQPVMLAGHSLGEYSALVVADSISFVDALQLVKVRAQCMATAIPKGVGSMAAVLGLSAEQVLQVCQQVSRADCLVEAANFNSPQQIVIAGHAEAVENAAVLAKKQGAKRVLPLAVSVPSHCSLLAKASSTFETALSSVPISSPKITLLHNVDAASHTHPDDIRTVLAEQMYKPVQWSKTIEHMCAEGVSHFIECGPGKVLSGLVKRYSRTLTTGALADVLGFEQAL